MVAFPDAIAARAVPQLAAEAQVEAANGGTIAELLESMDRAGVMQSWICSIATKPPQFDSIAAWSRSIASERLIPFLSVHPDAPDPAGRVHQAAEMGFRGLKLHPYYQQFSVDEPSVDPIWRAAAETGLIVLCHAGFDPGFPHDPIASPSRLRRVLDAHPGLRLIAAHLGGWLQWDEVFAHLLGQPVWIDVSASIALLGPERSRDLLLAHPPTHLLFGSDSPWFDQSRAVAELKALALPAALERAILFDNARALLALAPAGGCR